MPRTKRKSSAAQSQSRGLIWRYVLICLVSIIIAVSVTLFVTRADEPATPTVVVDSNTKKFPSLDELLTLPPEKLGDYGIAEMNLICAVGLPGSENLDIEHCLATLDKWADKVKFETERHLYRLTDPRYKDHAEHYKHSEARFRAE